MRVAVTGASGSIGAYVLRELLEHGHEPVAVGRRPAGSYVPFREASLDDVASLARAFEESEGVIHLAAIPSPYRAGLHEILEVNVAGTARTLDAAVEAGTTRFLFASSGAATGFSFPAHDRVPDYLPLDEEHPCAPDDAYGLSKLLGEELCARWSRAHGLATVALRINHNWYVDREGAGAALAAGGWARGLPVERLWERYRLQIEEPERERAPDKPPLPRDLLYAVTDARDAARAFRFALEAQTAGHEVLMINGFDTCSLVPSERLAAAAFPGVPVRTTLTGHATLVSFAKAGALIGYEPRYTWRESDFATWFRSR
jgi:nucleoside-diphosphate-sugar epimerase